jgi:hypothetical protein
MPLSIVLCKNLKLGGFARSARPGPLPSLFAPIHMKKNFIFLLISSSVFSLGFKINVELEKSRKSASSSSSSSSPSLLSSTFHPNSLVAQVDSETTVKVKIQDKETLDVKFAHQMVLVLKRAGVSKAHLMTKKGANYVYELVSLSLSL